MRSERLGAVQLAAIAPSAFTGGRPTHPVWLATSDRCAREMSHEIVTLSATP